MKAEMKIGDYFRPKLKPNVDELASMNHTYVPHKGFMMRVTGLARDRGKYVERYYATDGLNEYKFRTYKWWFQRIPNVPCSGPHVSEDCLKCERLPRHAQKINEAMAGVLSDSEGGVE